MMYHSSLCSVSGVSFFKCLDFFAFFGFVFFLFVLKKRFQVRENTVNHTMVHQNEVGRLVKLSLALWDPLTGS